MTDPNRRRLARALIWFGWIGIIAATSLAANTVRHRLSAAHRAAAPVTDEMLSAPATREDWPLYGGSYSNHRYSVLDQITPGNVDRLRVIWRDIPAGAPPPANRERQVSTPVVVDGVIYYTRSPNQVYAVDAATGRELWRFHHAMETAPYLCCGTANRGVAAYRDRIYVATLDAHLIALNKRTGDVIWDIEIDDPAQGYSETMAPLAVKGKIIIGSSGTEFGIRGFVDAYDWETGRRLWRFWTIPSPQQGGWWGKWSSHTSLGDSLPRNIARERADSARFTDSWRRGGGGVWMTPSYDAERNELYVGVGNPAPAVYDRSRPGDNLYTCSIVALDLDTGQLHWYYQMLPHDMWDTDASSPIVMADLQIGDSVVPVVMHAAKTGWVYTLDRRNGHLLNRSQPFVPMDDPFARPTQKGEVHFPVAHGGDPWAPPAYSPETGLLYVLGKHVPSIVKVDSKQPMGPAQVGGEILQADPHNQWGTFTAIDPRTGQIRWQRQAARPLSYSGVLATASGLVLYGDNQGHLNFWDARTGAPVKRLLLGGQIAGAPVAFMLNGREYLAVVTARGLTLLGLN
jgi:PQQ-dependent dehydrogenase (methanol/ethanol family)